MSKVAHFRARVERTRARIYMMDADELRREADDVRRAAEIAAFRDDAPASDLLYAFADELRRAMDERAECHTVVSPYHGDQTCQFYGGDYALTKIGEVFHTMILCFPRQLINLRAGCSRESTQSIPADYCQFCPYRKPKDQKQRRPPGGGV